MRRVERDVPPLSRQDQRRIEVFLEGLVSSGGETPDGGFDDFGRFWVKHDDSFHCLWHPELLGLTPGEWTLSGERSTRTGLFARLHELLDRPHPLCLSPRETHVSWELDLANIRMVYTDKSGIMRVGRSGYVLTDNDPKELDEILQRTNQGYPLDSFSERLFMQVLDEAHQGADVMCLWFASYLTKVRDPKRRQEVFVIPGLRPTSGRMVYDGVAIDLQTKTLIPTMIRRPLARSTWTLDPTVSVS